MLCIVVLCATLHGVSGRKGNKEREAGVALPSCSNLKGM